MAMMVALSLPGSSRLLPYLYDIMGHYVNEPSDGSSKIKSSNTEKVGCSVKYGRSATFLNSYPAWSSYRHSRYVSLMMFRYIGSVTLKLFDFQYQT